MVALFNLMSVWPIPYLFWYCSDKYTRFCQWKNLELNNSVSFFEQLNSLIWKWFNRKRQDRRPPKYFLCNFQLLNVHISVDNEWLQCPSNHRSRWFRWSLWLPESRHWKNVRDEMSGQEAYKNETRRNSCPQWKNHALSSQYGGTSNLLSLIFLCRILSRPTSKWFCVLFLWYPIMRNLRRIVTFLLTLNRRTALLLYAWHMPSIPRTNCVLFWTSWTAVIFITIFLNMACLMNRRCDFMRQK